MHPGEYISSIMKEHNISIVKLAKCLDVSTPAIALLIHKKVDMTSDMAIRLEYVFNRSYNSWMNMQFQYNYQQSVDTIDIKKLTKL